MEHIEYFDLIHSNPDRRKEVVSEEWTIFDAYESTITSESPILNFYKAINVQEIPKLVDFMQQFGIGEFSLSFTSTTLQHILLEFCNAGCIITGIREIPDLHTEPESKIAIPAVTLAIHY